MTLKNDDDQSLKKNYTERKMLNNQARKKACFTNVILFKKN